MTIILQYFFYLYNLEDRKKQMESKKQVTIKMSYKQKVFLRFNQTGVYEFKENNNSVPKKVFSLAKKLSFYLIKTQIDNNKYKFTIRVSQDNCFVQGILEGKQELQKLFKIIGHYSTILNLQEFVVSFKKIGQGAFAQVYQAVTNYQHKFALKSFEKKSLEKCDKTKKAFLNELQIMKKLNSPYIIPFDYVFQTQKAYYLKLQYLQKSLKQKISKKILIKQQKQIMKQLLLALVEMKNKNVIHRDLKPENIMIKKNKDNTEEVMVIDFGLATFTDVKEYIYFRCGTPGFLAPQIANLVNKKEKQLCSSDMFSLGCIFYKMLTGHYLFSGKNTKQVLFNNRKCLYPKNSFQKLSQNQTNLLVKMLHPDPNMRIKPQQALKDPYFNQDVDDNDQIPEQECGIQKYLKKIISKPLFKSMDSIKYMTDSFIENSVTSQAYKQRRQHDIKDSCLTFQFKFMDHSEQLNSSRKQANFIKGSRAHEKSKRQSRFSKLGRDVINMI